MLTNEFVWSETAPCREPSSEIVGGGEVCEVPIQLVMRFVIEALYGCIFDCAVHAFNLTIRPRVARHCQAMLDIELSTGRFKKMAMKRSTFRPPGPDIFRCLSIVDRIGEIRVVIGQRGLDAVGSVRPEYAGKPPATRRVAF